MALLPRENWTLTPYRWGLQKVLIGTDGNDVPHYEILRSHPWDLPAETTVQYKYCGDEAKPEGASDVSLTPKPDYCPWIAGHGTLVQADVDEVFKEDARLGTLLQDILDGEIVEEIPLLTTAGGMRGTQTLPLAVIFLGNAAALAKAAQEGRIERAAERLAAQGGTVA